MAVITLVINDWVEVPDDASFTIYNPSPHGAWVKPSTLKPVTSHIGEAKLHSKKSMGRIGIGKHWFYTEANNHTLSYNQIS